MSFLDQLELFCYVPMNKKHLSKFSCISIRAGSRQWCCKQVFREYIDSSEIKLVDQVISGVQLYQFASCRLGNIVMKKLVVMMESGALPLLV